MLNVDNFLFPTVEPIWKAAGSGGLRLALFTCCCCRQHLYHAVASLGYPGLILTDLGLCRAFSALQQGCCWRILLALLLSHIIRDAGTADSHSAWGVPFVLWGVWRGGLWRKSSSEDYMPVFPIFDSSLDWQREVQSYIQLLRIGHFININIRVYWNVHTFIFNKVLVSGIRIALLLLQKLSHEPCLRSKPCPNRIFSLVHLSSERTAN